MPVIRYRQLGNPFSDTFNTDQPTTATADSVTATPAPTATPAAPISLTTDTGVATTSDPLGILTSLVPILPATSAAAPSTTVATPSTAPTTSAIVQQNSTPTTETFTRTATRVFATASASDSASASTTPTSHVSPVAAGVVGGLIGVFSLALIIGFFLRRWNRHRSKARARESVDFGPAIFPTSTQQKQETEQKGYIDPAIATYQSPTIASYQPEVKAAAYSPRSEYSHMQQQPQIYSPHPHHVYPSAAQQVAYDYEGQQFAAQSDMGHHPNPHPASPPTVYHHNENAYGGM